MSKIEQFNSMDGYTFDEGVAFLRLCQAPEGVVMHIASTHNKSHLHSEIHKQLRMPGTMRLLKEKGFGRVENRGNLTQISHDFPNEETTESNIIEPNSNDDEPDSDETDPTEIILTKEDVRTHENTRLEDMPNDLCRNLWQKRQDVYREMQQAHLKMRAVPEGEEHNEERAKWRAEVLRLDAENDKYWQQIDAEIERFNAEKERADEKADKEKQAGFNVSTYRAYICKAIRKKELSPVQFAELQHRVNAMLAAGVEMDPETIEKLKAKGITVD